MSQTGLFLKNLLERVGVSTSSIIKKDRICPVYKETRRKNIQLIRKIRPKKSNDAQLIREKPGKNHKHLRPQNLAKLGL